MYAFALRAENRNDEVKLSAAIAKLVDEDPSLRFEQDPELQQSLLWGQGEMHLRVALDRLRSKYHIGIEGRPPHTAYRETIRKSAQSHGRHKKQSGGHGQFGDVKIEIRPRQRGEGFEFVDKIVGGSVPRQYIPAVEAGAREFLQRGPLGFPVVDVSVTLFDGQFHSVDSSEIAFRMATALALREGLRSCEPVLLEPILAVEISVPTEYTSRALQLVSQKRGQILGYDAKEDWSGWDRISAHIPQAEIHDLIVSLRSLSQGVAFFDWRYDHLNPVPGEARRDRGRAPPGGAGVLSRRPAGRQAALLRPGAGPAWLRYSARARRRRSARRRRRPDRSRSRRRPGAGRSPRRRRRTPRSSPSPSVTASVKYSTASVPSRWTWTLGRSPA